MLSILTEVMGRKIMKTFSETESVSRSNSSWIQCCGGITLLLGKQQETLAGVRRHDGSFPGTADIGVLGR